MRARNRGQIVKTDGKLMRGAGERGESYFPLACFSDISWSFVELALIPYPNLLFTKPKASLTRELGKRLARRSLSLNREQKKPILFK